MLACATFVTPTLTRSATLIQQNNETSLTSIRRTQDDYCLDANGGYPLTGGYATGLRANVPDFPNLIHLGDSWGIPSGRTTRSPARPHMQPPTRSHSEHYKPTQTAVSGAATGSAPETTNHANVGLRLSSSSAFRERHLAQHPVRLACRLQ